jgi:HK97 family phage prohead protease
MPATSDLELRIMGGECRVDPANERRIVGHAIVFDSLSENLGGFREIIKPSAVDRTLTEALDVRALADHDSGKVLGRTRAGTLQLRKDTRGLSVSIEPDPEISYARDLMRAVARGDISGMSFGFRVLEDDWREDPETGMPIRDVLDMRVSEVSVVAFPAYPATDVKVSQRSLDALREFKQAGRWTRAEVDRRLRLAR